jgi:hypothetical protein
VAQGRPPPRGAPAWSEEDVDDLILETVARVDPARVVLAANEAEGDADFVSWIRAALRTTLDLRARGTPAGRVIRAMDDALRADANRFVSARGYWQLVGDRRAPEWGSGTAPLVEAAWSVETATVRLSAATTRSPRMAHRRDIRAVCEAVLDLAGPLPKAELAGVLAERFNVSFAARFEYLDLDTDDEDAGPAATVVGAPDAAVDDELAAHWMLGQLTSEERRVLEKVVGGSGVRALAGELGCGTDKAALIRRRLIAKLRRLADAVGDDGQTATARLLDHVAHHDRLRHSLDQDGAFDAD